jgi:hypothetical protein
MRSGLDREWFERIWRFSVLPYIEEQFFDEPDRVADFELERLEKVPGEKPFDPSAAGVGGDEAGGEETPPTDGVGADGD